MSFFAVVNCTQQGCLNWRENNTCAKNGMSMAKQTQLLVAIHDPELCQIRRQLNEYRMQNLLENTP